MSGCLSQLVEGEGPDVNNRVHVSTQAQDPEKDAEKDADVLDDESDDEVWGCWQAVCARWCP